MIKDYVSEDVSYDPKRTASQRGDSLCLMPSPALSSLDAHFLNALVGTGFKA